MVNYNKLELLWYWIREREAVRLRKESGEDHPWSEDHIFNTYHFCNVRREDDRGTKEIREVVLASVLVGDLPWGYTLARLFNSAATLEVALNGGGQDKLIDMQAAGEKIFHTAYLVSTCGQKMNKIDYVFALAKQVKKLDVPRRGLADAHAKLMSVNGLGSFMAAQVVADLRNDRYLQAGNIHEHQYWSAWGPGSKKGLTYIFGNSTPSIYDQQMRQLFLEMPLDIRNMNIHGQDLQNCLCEFSKYVRHLDGLGGRNRYYEGK